METGHLMQQARSRCFLHLRWQILYVSKSIGIGVGWNWPHHQRWVGWEVGWDGWGQCLGVQGTRNMSESQEQQEVIRVQDFGFISLGGMNVLCSLLLHPGSQHRTVVLYSWKCLRSWSCFGSCNHWTGLSVNCGHRRILSLVILSLNGIFPFTLKKWTALGSKHKCTLHTSNSLWTE